MRNTQAPAFYRFKIGSFEATVISDGPLDLGEPKATMFGGLSQEEFNQGLSDNFLPHRQIVPAAERARGEYRPPHHSV